MKQSSQSQWSFNWLIDRQMMTMTNDTWQEWMMMIIAKICYNERWQEQCMIDENDAMNEDFYDNEAF